MPRLPEVVWQGHCLVCGREFNKLPFCLGLLWFPSCLFERDHEILHMHRHYVALFPPGLKLFCTQSSHGKIDKAEPWTLEIISYWSEDELSRILDNFTLDRQIVVYKFGTKVRCSLACPWVPVCFRVPTSPHPQVPKSLSPHFPESPCLCIPTSLRPCVPTSPSSQVLRPHPTFGHSCVDRALILCAKNIVDWQNHFLKS